jgi:hypothetical protein
LDFGKPDFHNFAAKNKKGCQAISKILQAKFLWLAKITPNRPVPGALPELGPRTFCVCNLNCDGIV